MNLLDLFKKGSGILCPRCEEPLEGHDEEKCARRMTRRHFVGVWGAAIAVAYGVGSDGKEKIILATPEHVKRLETEYRASDVMVSARGGYVITSALSHNRFVGRLKSDNGPRYGSNDHIIQDTRMQEVLKLRAKGFHVKLFPDKSASTSLWRAEDDYRSFAAKAAWLPDAVPDTEFPSVDRW